MTKNELIAAVAEKARMPRLSAAAAVEATFDIIVATLGNGGEVKVSGFGNFRAVQRAARAGRDPRTGETVQIQAVRRPKFSPGKAFKEVLNR